ncbi:hypothetical protein IPG41_04930 [Candidatus Peregrinibacteria bacterium]|nr:MAG: hypothetical protein IPG41_04930 [Candidatus Peregrinibacteria bacterium]
MKAFLMLCAVFLLVACQPVSFNVRCYEIVGDPDGTRLIIDESPSAPMLTITDPVGGQPVEVPGRLEEGIFVYPDGSHLNYNEERAWYDEDAPFSRGDRGAGCGL